MKKTLFVLGLAAALAGCDSPAPSLHPLISPNQTVVVQGLEGSWAENESTQENAGGSPWTFELQKDRSYKLTIQDADEEASQVFSIHLATLGGHLFMDAILTESTIRGEKVDIDTFSIPIHLFGRIEVEQDQVHMRLLSAEWLKKALEDGREKLRHEKIDENILLTATTQELQEFAIRCGWDHEVFSQDTNLRRRKPAP